MTFRNECDKVNELLISNESQKSLKSFFLPESIWQLIRNNVLIYCFKVASLIEAFFLNVTTFSQVKMSLCNNLLRKLLHVSKSFKVFHCSVIKVLCFVVISDNFYIVSDVWSLVNNFLIYFFAFIAIRIDFCRASRVSLVIISCSPTLVNNKFHFFAFSFFPFTGLPPAPLSHCWRRPVQSL